MLEFRLWLANAYYERVKHYRAIKSVCLWEVLCMPWLSMHTDKRWAGNALKHIGKMGKSSQGWPETQATLQ